MTDLDLRLAVIVATGAESGPGRQLAALLRGLGDLGAQTLAIELLRSPHSGRADGLARAVTQHVVVADRSALDPRIPGAVDAVLRRWRPTVVQTHGYKASAVAYLLRRRPWIGCFHGSTAENLKVRLYHRLDRWLLRRADRIVVMSRRQAEEFAGRGGRGGRGGQNGRVCVIRNAVIPRAPEPGVEVDEAVVGLRAGLVPPVVGVVGRLSPEKGVDLFLEACALLDRRGTLVSAVVAGDGPERRRLDRLREQLGLSARVRLLGHVRAIHAFYRCLNVLVIPSRSEGLPNALLEGLAAGARIVATAVGAIPDVLEGLDDCVLVPAGSAAALASGIERAMRLRPNGAAARERVLEHYSLDRRVADHIALYRAVLGAGRR